MKKTIVSVLVLLFGLLIGVVWAEPKDDTKLESLTQDGYTLKYEKTDEQLAKQILPELVKRAATRGASEIEFAKTKRQELLNAIAAEINLSKPTKEMGICYDECVKALTPLEELFRDCRTYVLMRTNGEGMTLGWNPTTKKLALISRTEAGIQQIDISQIKVIPIGIDTKRPGTDLEKALKDLDALFIMPFAGTVCHEVAESSVAAGLKLNGAFIRWFTDGCGNYVAAKVVGDLVGKAAADKFLVSLGGDDAATYAPRADLFTWRAYDWQTDMPPADPHVDQACYIFAYQEIAGLVKRHGDDTLKRVCKEIAASKDKVRNEKTISDAIYKVTGEDVRTTFAKYGAKSDDKFKGIAIKDVGCRSYTIKGRTGKLGSDSTTIKLVDDERQGLVVGFTAVTLDRPVAFRLYFKPYPNMSCGIGDERVINPNQSNPETVVFAIPCSEVCRYDPGEYPVQIRVGDEVLKEIKIKLVR